MAGALGRRVPPDWEHVEKYPLRALDIEVPRAKGGVLGINWYPEFDRPYKGTDGHWYVKAPAAGSRPRGGHCVALKGRGIADNLNWWDFYNQGNEGACVGFGCSRMMTLHNRKRYFGRWLWDRAKEIDYWDDTNPGDSDGTSVRAGLEILRDKGHVAWSGSNAQLAADEDWRLRLKLLASPPEGISAYRWATSTGDMVSALGYSDKQYVDVLNSWGRGYPHLTRFPLDAIERVFAEDGEFGIPTDR